MSATRFDRHAGETGSDHPPADAEMKAAVPVAELEGALERIVSLSNECSSNKLGSAELHRKRWLKLADIAKSALNAREQQEQQ